MLSRYPRQCPRGRDRASWSRCAPRAPICRGARTRPEASQKSSPPERGRIPNGPGRPPISIPSRGPPPPCPRRWVRDGTPVRRRCANPNLSDIWNAVRGLPMRRIPKARGPLSQNARQRRPQKEQKFALDPGNAQDRPDDLGRIVYVDLAQDADDLGIVERLADPVAV